MATGAGPSPRRIRSTVGVSARPNLGHRPAPVPTLLVAITVNV
jgi:hypothetical protein